LPDSSRNAFWREQRRLDLRKERASVTVSLVEISIKDLHEKTGELVRQAALARNPVKVTDRGKVIAVLGSPKLIKAAKGIKRGLPGEYLAFVKTLPRTEVMQYLDELRGER
jgi:antitoxin (DNA-binding transcriptional repressor) of toxin-antitoxin stability system